MSRNVIQDGYTKSARINAVPRLHESIEFTFRPMLPEDVEDLSAKVRKLQGDAKKMTLMIADAVSKHLTEWSEVDATDKPLPISVNNCRRLPYPLLGGLRYIIEGIRAGDAPEDGKDGGNDDELDKYVDGLEAEVNGTSEMREAEKNLGEG